MKLEQEFFPVPKWLARREDFTPLDKMLYGLIWSLCQKKGFAWASTAWLATELGSSQRQVFRSLQRHVDAHTLTVDSGKDRNGSTNRYTVHVLAMESAQKDEKSQVLPSDGKSYGYDFLSYDRMPESQMGYDKKSYKEKSEEKGLEEVSEKSATLLRNVAGVSLRETSGIPPINGKNQTNSSQSEQTISHVSNNFSPDERVPSWALAQLEQNPQMELAVPGDDEQEQPIAMDPLELKRLSEVAAGAAESNRKTRQAQQDKRDKKLKMASNLKGSVVPTHTRKTYERLKQTWFDEFKTKFPHALTARDWTPKDYKHMKDLLALYAEEDITRGMKYLIRQWSLLRPKIFKGNDALPVVSHLRMLHEKLIPEAKLMEFAIETHRKFNEWNNTHVMDMLPPPPELQAAYDTCRSDLKTLGLVKD